MVQLFYGVTFTFANDVIDGGYIQPFGFILFRISSAGILFWVFSLFTTSEKIERKDFPKLIMAAFFGVALNMLAFFKGLQFTTPINGSVIMVTTPIIVLVLSALILREKVTRIKIFGIFILTLALISCGGNNDGRPVQDYLSAFLNGNEKIVAFGKADLNTILNKSEYKKIPKFGLVISKELESYKKSLNTETPIFFALEGPFLEEKYNSFEVNERVRIYAENRAKTLLSDRPADPGGPILLSDHRRLSLRRRLVRGQPRKPRRSSLVGRG